MNPKKRVKDLTPAEHEKLKAYDRARHAARKLESGQRIKGISTLRREDGSIISEWEKTERESNDPPAYPIVGEGFAVKRVTSMLDGQGQVRVQHISTERAEAERYADFKEAIASACAEHVERVAPVACRGRSLASELLQVYPIGDPHIGMLAHRDEAGEDFDLKIAESELYTAIDLLVERAKPANTALLVDLGDYFHADDDTQVTPGHHHKLDVDSRSHKIANVGFRLKRRLIVRLLERHKKVIVWCIRGNHDPKMGLMLRLWLETAFEKNPRVTVEPNAGAYSYLRFGKNLLGGCHGHDAPPRELPGIMACDRKEDWGATDFHWFMHGHVHHEGTKEYPGCWVESFATLAAKDAWTAKRFRAGRFLSTICIHEEYGEIDRQTVDRKLVLARLAGVL